MTREKNFKAIAIEFYRISSVEHVCVCVTFENRKYAAAVVVIQSIDATKQKKTNGHKSRKNK